MTNLRATQPHFVRCIVPNENKTPGSIPRAGLGHVGDIGEGKQSFPLALQGVHSLKVNLGFILYDT